VSEADAKPSYQEPKLNPNLETLNDQLDAARGALNAALEAGSDTSEPRYLIAHLENQLAAY
jgi:hypothetical protein